MDVSNKVPNVFVDNDRREDYENVILVECNGIKLGMQVGSEEEAYNLYSEYALKKGFSIQKWNKWEVDGILKQQEYVCSKQEYKQFEDPFKEKKNFKKFNHLETRMGCCARIRFDMKDDVFSVALLNDIHNHDFATQEEMCNLRSGRKVLC